VFAWSTSDFVGVNRDVIEHFSPSSKPKKQKLYKMALEKVEAVKVEVQRLLDVGFMKDVKYPEWLVNVTMVRKKWKVVNVYRLYRPKEMLPQR
jgi:hypothetical protein